MGYQTTKLNAALQKESNAKEEYIQTWALIEEQTSLEVLQIDNNALRVEKAALADATLIRETADFQAKKLIETRRSDGLRYMLEQLGLQTDEHKASLDYITTLINNKESITPYINGRYRSAAKASVLSMTRHNRALDYTNHTIGPSWLRASTLL